jgi:hypothetical protein
MARVAFDQNYKKKKKPKCVLEKFKLKSSSTAPSNSFFNQTACLDARHQKLFSSEHSVCVLSLLGKTMSSAIWPTVIRTKETSLRGITSKRPMQMQAREIQFA